jgi:Holliday junction resolvase RusA-like endonuclease
VRTKETPLLNYHAPIEIIIPIEPVAKARSRTALRNGKVRSYTPERTQIAQDFIKTFLQPYKHLCFPVHVPIKMTVVFNRTKSIWLPKKERFPFRKPDTDNFIKLVLDSINTILIPDDAQVTTIVASKRWTDENKGYIFLMLEEDNDG